MRAHLLVQLLDAAVQQDIFDQPPNAVAAVLSGGVDSSTVVRLARKWLPDMPVFTGYYDDDGFDERSYARMAAGNHCHVEIRIVPTDFVENFDDMLRHFRPPYQGMGMFGQYMVAKYIGTLWPNIRVVLSGEGADELFGGYARLMKVAGVRLPDGYEDYQLPDGYPTNLKDALAYDYERLPQLLAVDDQALGAFGIEARAPFTNERVVKYALTGIPASERVGKQHLKFHMRGIVPNPILDRTDKRGFPCPLVKWANEHATVRDFVADRIGYVPDPGRPWDRGWWYELLRSGTYAAAA